MLKQVVGLSLIWFHLREREVADYIPGVRGSEMDGKGAGTPRGRVSSHPGTHPPAPCTHTTQSIMASAGPQSSPGMKQALAKCIPNWLNLLTFQLSPPKVRYPTQISLHSAPEALMINCEKKSLLRGRGGILFFFLNPDFLPASAVLQSSICHIWVL